MMFPAMKSSMACLMTDTAPPDIFFMLGIWIEMRGDDSKQSHGRFIMVYRRLGTNPQNSTNVSQKGHGGFQSMGVPQNHFVLLFFMFHYLNHPAIGIRPHLWKPSYVRAE
jgi:hypothetical protein